VWDSAEFGQNILAEMSEVLLSVFLAILVVDQLMKRERRRRMSGIRRVLAHLIGAFLQDFVYECNAYFASLPSSVIVETYVPESLYNRCWITVVD
jgi:hypothetical protein